MGRQFSKMDIEIFNKLAPEAGGNLNSEMGHPYPFILRPISHRIAESSEDFKQRIERLNAEELDYLIDLAIKGEEDVRSLDPEDIDAFTDVIEEKISAERAKELRLGIGIV